MRSMLLAFLALFIVTRSAAQNCDIATTGIAIVNAANTAPVTGGCISLAYNFKFSIANLGSDPGCSIPANTVTAVFDFPTLTGGVKPYIYSGPASFVSGYFSWTYDSFEEVLIGINTTAIPNGLGDAGILVKVTGHATGSGTSALNLSQDGGTPDNVANNTGSAQFSVGAMPSISDQPNQSKCSNGSFTMTQSGGGLWSLVSGSASITTPSSPTTTVTGVPVGTAAVLRWSVTSGSCTVSDDVTLTNNPPPAISVISVVNNNCHAGSSGSISVTTGSGYAFTIAGPTVNTTGQSTGVFTGLLAGNYTVNVTAAGCSNSINATVTEPPGLLPDISLGSDYDANFFITPGQENNIVFNVSEIAGNAATGDTIRLVKIPGYAMTFNAAATTITIGSTNYLLDNNRWKLDDSNPAFASLILDPAHNNTAGTLNCAAKVYVSLKFKRNTPNSSTFSLSGRLRKANAESNLGNNLNTIVFTAE